MALEPAAQLENHPRVELDGDNGLDAGLEQPLGEISRSGPDLEDGVGGLEAGLGDDGVHQRRVPQDVLALGLLERDPALQPRAAAAATSAVSLLLDLAAGHGGVILGYTLALDWGGGGLSGVRRRPSVARAGSGQREEAARVLGASRKNDISFIFFIVISNRSRPALIQPK